MNVYEVRYTNKYSHNPAICKKGYKVKHYVQKEDWKMSQFEPCDIMEHKYLSHKKMTPNEISDLVFKSSGGTVKLGHSSLFELWQFDSLVTHLNGEGFTLKERVEAKKDYYSAPFSDTYTSPCGNYYFVIVKNRTWYDIYSGISEKHPEYEVAKKYGGKLKCRIGHWMSSGGTLERSNEMRCAEDVFNLILKSYKNIKEK
ncbi:hypothetical protein VPH5P1C_0035 [Vibrio phage 5P1c]